jgi:hypothetical protein
MILVSEGWFSDFHYQEIVHHLCNVGEGLNHNRDIGSLKLTKEILILQFYPIIKPLKNIQQ